MDRISGQKSASNFLFPPIEPYHRQMLDVGEGHTLYVEQCGNPDGIPVVVLHGGPGGGCSPMMRRFFDPKEYRVILFDQRGCGRSTPHATVKDNTTWHLVRDIELIRETLAIDRWVVFGGSWGATLALIYAETHPEMVAYLSLRGVFLSTQTELDWFYGGGAGRFFPDVWDRFETIIPENERHDMIAAYHRRLFSGDRETEVKYARAWASWENSLASVNSTGASGDAPADYALAFARIENHYFTHGGFLARDGQILADAGKIAHIPACIIQGRQDMICPPRAAYELAARMPKAELHFVPSAGHAVSEPGITEKLVQVMNRLTAQKRMLSI